MLSSVSVALEGKMFLLFSVYSYFSKLFSIFSALTSSIDHLIGKFFSSFFLLKCIKFIIVTSACMLSLLTSKLKSNSTLIYLCSENVSPTMFLLSSCVFLCCPRLLHQDIPVGIFPCSSLNCPSHKLGTSLSGPPKRMKKRRVVIKPAFGKSVCSFLDEPLTPI